MAFNRLFLKVISIIQIVMTAIFIVLGMVDRFEARFIYTSFLFTPCWIAALVLPAGVMGLILATSSRPSSTLATAQSSVSLACAVVSAVTLWHYGWAITYVLSDNLFEYTGSSSGYFTDKDKKVELTKQEKAMVATSLLVVVFSIIEIALAVASARSSDACNQTPQANQVTNRGVGSYFPAGGNAYSQLGAEQIPLQPTYIAAQPMVAIPVSSQNVNQ